MFTTTPDQRHPMSAIFADQMSEYWTSFELAFNVPWYVMTLVETEQSENGASQKEALKFGRTVVTSNVDEIADLASAPRGGSIELQIVYAMLPGRAGKHNDWKMKRLQAVWSSETDNSPFGRLRINMIETDDGERHPLRHLGSALGPKREYELVCRFPQKR